MKGVTRQKLSELVSIGGQMANVCFNLGQNASGPVKVLSTREQEIMQDLDRQWRAKVQEIGAAIGAAKKPRERKR